MEGLLNKFSAILLLSLLQLSIVCSGNTVVTKTQVVTSSLDGIRVDKFHPSSSSSSSLDHSRHGQSQGHGSSQIHGHGQGHDGSHIGNGLQFKSLDRLRHAGSRFESFIERMEIGIKTGILSKVVQMIKLKFDSGEINLHKFVLDFNQTYPLTLHSLIAQSSDDAHFLMDKLHGRLDALGNHIKGFSLMFENNRGFIDYSHGHNDFHQLGHSGGH